METLRDNYPHAGRMAVRPLHVVVVGAGITGLTAGLALRRTGHSVTILEQAPQISEVGAGLQMAPNATRILSRLGVLESVVRKMTMITRASLRRYDDEEVTASPGMPMVGFKFGAPAGVIHRGDLQRILLDAAEASGCKIITGRAVQAVDPCFLPRILAVNKDNGSMEWYQGDVIIAADGIKSSIRRQMAHQLGFSNELIPTGDAAYRLLIPREKVLNNNSLLELMDGSTGMRYMGPGGHIVGYPIKQNTLYNLVLIHPSKEKSGSQDEEIWERRGNRDEMLAYFKNWCPTIQAWLSLTDDEVVDWPLKTMKPLPTWVQGEVALAGDACHPMLPYIAQGAANGIEDAAVLATAFTCTDNIPEALALYQDVRKLRADTIAASASITGASLHLPDGEMQRKRDQMLRAQAAMLKSGVKSDDKWSDAKSQEFMWSTDVMMETITAWEKIVGSREVSRV
ncbi:hypothetical protein B0I35DRAFT_348493 [Stachybotrys elegans]|uniref:FAD-binding domain-containing protein n=1 Tax=Stachybotrys elegans TaxID=80388 RepID=A0A8K0SXC9_9HYPO|nr:hypothetical protein B0I35DRAFT_348493 [Stachybotrys elegans]